MEVSFSQESYRKESAREESLYGNTGNGRSCLVDTKEEREEEKPLVLSCYSFMDPERKA